MAGHVALSMELDFSPGMKLSQEIHRTFNRSVHPTKDTGHFTMVVSFSRHSFRLDVENVGLALESAIGGYCSQLKVSYLFCSMCHAKRWGSLSCITEAVFALNSNASFIFGAMVALIGKKSLGFGNRNATKSGRYLALPRGELALVWMR